MRLLITGVSGLVGGNLAALAAAAGHEVIGVVGRWDGAPLAGVTKQLRADLRDAAQIAALVRDAAPDAIVNGAAQSEPAKCDEDPVTSQALNVQLPRVLAEEAQRRGARFVHLSSEQVFAGDRAPYRTGDPVAPLNLYARQKVESERAVAAAAPQLAATVRAPLLMGNSPGGRRSVHERMLLDWMAGKTLRLNTDEIRQPCSADNLAAALVELVARREFTGAFHWAGTDAVSRHALGLALARHFGVAESSLAAVRLGGTPAAATRPLDLTLDLAPLAGALRTRPESLAEQLPRLAVPAHAQAWLAANAAPRR